MNRGVSKTISVWGHSMVPGAGSTNGLNAFGQLLGLLGEYRTLNIQGIGGQTSTQIATRFGAIPWQIRTSGGFLTIGEEVSVTFMSSYALQTAADNTTRYASGTLLTSLGGVVVKQRCRITRSATGSAPNQTETNTITLLSNYFGQGAPIKDNSVFIPDAGQNAIDDINIFWMSRNDGNLTLAAQNVDKCIDFLADPKRFLIMGELPNNNELPGTAGRIAIDTYNATLFQKYSDNFIVSTPPTDEELAFYKYTPTSDELTDIVNGIFPRGMRPDGDSVHLNNSGYGIIAYRLWKKFKQFGY